jgi:hypothetical protein
MCKVAEQNGLGTMAGRTAANQAPSTASTVGDLKTAFNALIAELKAKGLMVADINITAFDAIANVDAGKAGSATYADAAAVIAALPENVTANSDTIEVPVTTWVDTDTYSASTAGSYTFTATLGTLPNGVYNPDSKGITVEVVVAAA